MEQCPSWEPNNHSASQEISRLLWSPKFHCRDHKSPPLAHILSQTHPFYTFPPYFPKINHNIILSTLRSSKWSLPFRLCDQSCACTYHLARVRATCLTHPVVLGLITLIISSEVYNLWSSSLCSLLQPPTTSSLLDTNILLSTLFSNTLNLRSAFRIWQTNFHTHTKQQVKL